MSVELKVPQSGESITEVQIGQWRKSEGDFVKADEVLVEIETDKAAIELPAPVSGRISKILKKNGEEAAVGDVIAVMDEGEGAAAEPAAAEAPAAKPAEEAPAPEAEPRQEPAKAEQAKPAAARPEEADGAPRVTPAARRALAQVGLRPQDVEPSGPGGRILKEDVERAAARLAENEAEPEPAAAEPEEAPSTATAQVEHPEPAKAPPAEPAPAPKAEKPEAPAAPPAPSSEPGREEEVVAMTPMRKVIARNLVAAQQNAALLTTFNEVDMSVVMDLRKRNQEAFQQRYGIKLGFMSFFVKAAVEALRAVPQVNARIDGNYIVYRKYHDVGIAVGGGRGLVVPILRNAERMSFSEIEQKISDFAERAKANKIELAELQGGTFTISNGGIYGSMLSTPIVNPPQSGILGLHAIQERPVARDGQVVIRPMMYVALTYDHRLVDGREAVGFLRQIRDVMERPERMLLQI